MKTYHNSKAQMIGFMEDGIFYKRVKRSKHLFKMLQAWGFEQSTIDQIKDECKEIRIKDTESGMVYSAPFQMVLDHGIKKNFETPQVFLPLKFFDYQPVAQQTLIQ